MLAEQSVITILIVYVVHTNDISETCAANPRAKSVVVQEQLMYLRRTNFIAAAALVSEFSDRCITCMICMHKCRGVTL